MLGAPPCRLDYQICRRARRQSERPRIAALLVFRNELLPKITHADGVGGGCTNNFKRQLSLSLHWRSWLRVSGRCVRSHQAPYRDSCQSEGNGHKCKPKPGRAAHRNSSFAPPRQFPAPRARHRLIHAPEEPWPSARNWLPRREMQVHCIKMIDPCGKHLVAVYARLTSGIFCCGIDWAMVKKRPLPRGTG